MPTSFDEIARQRLTQPQPGAGPSFSSLVERKLASPAGVTLTEVKPSFFEPSPEGIRIRDVARELPGAFVQTAKSIGQSIAKSFLATGATISKMAESDDPNIFRAFKDAIKTAEFKPETRFQRALTGGDQPVSFESIGEETLSIFGQ